jgi:hypothetical protein
MTVGCTEVQGARHAEQVHDHSHVATGLARCNRRPEQRCIGIKYHMTALHRSTGTHSIARSAVRGKNKGKNAYCFTTALRRRSERGGTTLRRHPSVAEPRLGGGAAWRNHAEAASGAWRNHATASPVRGGTTPRLVRCVAEPRLGCVRCVAEPR